MSPAGWGDGGLEALFGKTEGGVREALDEAGHLLHRCECGHTVYDPLAVSAAVRHAFGHERERDILDWARSLAEQFGWRHQTSPAPEDGRYYCPHCDPRPR